jgi:arylsulfatase A-like enzyme
MIGSDVFPTMLSAAGVDVPGDRVLDGANLLPVLTESAREVERSQPLYWRLQMAPNAKIAMRVGDWKILADDKLEQFELYNLREDERETTDLKERELERFAELKSRLVAQTAAIEAEGPDWWKTLGANGGRVPQQEKSGAKSAEKSARRKSGAK